MADLPLSYMAIDVKSLPYSFLNSKQAQLWILGSEKRGKNGVPVGTAKIVGSSDHVLGQMILIDGLV
ncbi:hypothetical protein [Synechocystis sp. LEGE 06083]|uniref:hypothetical protein n=1 Tax=Synechocystis sp. LEGE 06083 TaxID=915336 RepID=UPI001D134320|nr:hypothetical protein [Synechocystis sp. LEGE 06083]